ncbi:MAG TPA: NADPH:quinone oxidoreductase family protein [Novosphingobium sp.]|nr:NADPH:quinone oxidoreductase family protein [Novosphingobium sp.]
MQALQVQSLSPDLSGCSVVSVPEPERKPDQVLVRVRAVSLNYPDLLMTRGDYQLKPPLPFTPGMDVAGEVIAADPDSGFAPGDGVMGGAGLGGMAELVALDASGVRPIPPQLDFARAAAFGAAYHTAWVALVELGQLQPGQWVLVHGATGGVGLAAADLAKALGAKVIVTSGSAEKLAVVACEYAPDAAILATGRFREAVAELTGGALADLVYDPVGGDVLDESTRCVAFGGKLLVVGFASGRIADISTNIPLIKGFSIVGVRAGEWARRFPERGKIAHDRVHALLAGGRLRPRVDRVLSLADWKAAFTAMSRREMVGKIVLAP